MAVLYESDAFSIVVLLTEKPYSSFLKKISFSRNLLKYWKRSKFPLIVKSLNGKLFWKCNVQFLEESMLFLLALKWSL